MTDKLPADAVYEKGIPFNETVLSRVELNGDVWEGIDWDVAVDTPEAIRQATAVAATQFHYANTAHLLLCGKVIKHELPQTSIDTQKLAISLASHKAEDIDVWGRYLKAAGAGAPVSPELKTYYRHLFSEEDACRLFLGMETLGGPIAHGVYSLFQESGDPLFQQICGNMVEQKDREMQITVDHAQAIFGSADSTAEELQATSQEYLSLVTELMEAHKPQFAALDVDMETVHDTIKQRVTRFYQDIGIRT